jgi:hypothetical protein
MIDKRPRIFARCADVADVITAVNFGRDNDLLIAIRGGGHNGPGLASVDLAREPAPKKKRRSPGRSKAARTLALVG